MSAPQKLEVVDAHHHLWDLEACDYPWLMDRGSERFFGNPEPIQKNYLVSDFLDDARSYNVTASVHIQVGTKTGHELTETAWLSQTAENDGFPSAIVPFCDLSHPDAVHQILQHLKYDRVRGFRQIVGRSAEEDATSNTGKLLTDKTWIKNVEFLTRHDLSFDLQMIPSQAHQITKVLSTMPDLKVVICHCGSPWDQTQSGLDSWLAGLALLAELPRVYCKISGLGMFDHEWTVDSIRPIVKGCINLFGAKRCMFGSNFPVDKLHGSYDKVWSAFEEITKDMSDVNRKSLFKETAKDFYRI